MALNIVPNAGQTLGATRDPIRVNFSTIDTAFQVDHVAYNTAGGGDQGKHAKLTFPNLAAPAAPAATEVQMYNNNGTGAIELYVKKGAGTAIPFTRSGGTIGTSTGRGFSYLPSGIIMKWNQLVTAGGTLLIDVNGAQFAGSPAMANIFSVQLTPVDDVRVWFDPGSLAFPNFTVEGSANASRFIVLVIGN